MRTIGLKHVFGILSARTKERQPKPNNGEAQLGLGITGSNNYILRIKNSGFSRVITEGGKKPSDFCFRWQQILLDRRLSRPVWHNDQINDRKLLFSPLDFKICMKKQQIQRQLQIKTAMSQMTVYLNKVCWLWPVELCQLKIKQILYNLQVSSHGLPCRKPQCCDGLWWCLPTVHLNFEDFCFGSVSSSLS